MDVLCVILLLVGGTAVAREYTGEELISLPKLFDLDDYERCLTNKDGLYCLGVFDLTPDVHPNPTYQLLKEYSDESHRHFNRTRIHRGTCVSSRCPQEAVRNASQHFEQCVGQWARTRKLRASIKTLHYCHTHADRHDERATASAQQIFLQCVYAIVAVNIIATIHDIYTRNEPNKNKLITAFSIPANWRRLTFTNEAEDARMSALTPLNGVRVMSMTLSTFAHAILLHYHTFYSQNPEFQEKQTQRMLIIYLSAGTALIQGLMMLSCFLTCYNLLIFSQKRSLSLFMLPMCIMKRVIRTLPVTLLIISFGATWWSHTRDGPLVPTTIGLESRACQSKFWSHIFYTNNMVDATNYCVMPTWYLAVDMHMYIVACTLTLIMYRHRGTALKLYSVLFLASCAVIGVVAYIKKYKSMVYLTTPEEMRHIFRESSSFTEFYISSWGALPACFLGLILAHIQFELDERGIKLSEYKWFVFLHICMVPVAFLWSAGGKFARSHSSSIFHALHVAFDRPIFCILLSIPLLGIINIESPLRRVYSWSGFTRMSRVLLSVMMLHWCVNMAISTRSTVYNTSVFDMVVEWVSTHVITYALAVPVTLVVEIPMQKFLGMLIFGH